MQEQTTEAAKQVDAILEVLADRFGTTVDALWEILVGYHQTVGWGMAILGAFFFVALSVATWMWVPFCIRKIKAEKAAPGSFTNEVEWGMGLAFPTLAVWFGFAMFVMMEGIGIFTRIATPEYHAIKDILSRVG